jgi:opacity protein-like surface antigen
MVHAQLADHTQRAGHWDISVQTRYTDSKDYSGDGGSRLSLQDDLGWGFGFGYHINEVFNVGFVMSWRSINYNATVVDADDPDSVVYYASWLDTGSFAVTGEWNVLPKRFTPYVSGALGWTTIDTNIQSGSYYPGCWWDPWWGYVCYYYPTTYGKNAFAYTVGAGLRFELSPMFFVRFGYDYNGVDLNEVDGLSVFRLDAGVTL